MLFCMRAGEHANTRPYQRPPADRYFLPSEQKRAFRKGPILRPALEQDHWRFNEQRHDDIYVVGDVHGCIDALQTLWDRLSPSGDDLVVFVGDLVRKGPASNDVVEFVVQNDHAVSVRGNNEAKILNGQVDPDPFAPVVNAIESFPLVISWGDAMVVHGGVDPRQPLPEHDQTQLLETRSIPPGNGYDGPFWFEQYDELPQVFFGHTVLEQPFVSSHAVGLDTGCVYGGELTAYDYRANEIINISSEHTYEQRPNEKFLNV